MAERAAQTQGCPACGKEIEIASIEPLRRMQCPHCQETFRVQPTFGNFQVVETLGAGGMGTVYKARDVRLGREVALKVLRRQTEPSAEQQAHLQEEARLTASINHPNVVRVYSSGTAHGQFYIVMELVEGGSLDDAIEERKNIPEEETLAWGIQIARGLEAAREAGLLHRDVKPGNILYSDRQTPKIVDFGLAGAAQAGGDTGAIWGTPYYVAPERLERIPEDHRSDIYSLAATLFHALAGRPPIDADTNSATRLRELKNSPPDLSNVANVSAATANAIKRALLPDPATRTASYAEFIDDLQRARRTLEETREKLEARSARRKRILKSALLSLFLLAVLLGAATWIVSARNKRQRAFEAAHEAAMAPYRARFAEATSQVAAGDFNRSEKTLTELASVQGLEQPLLNFVRLHLVLVFYLQNKAAEARAAAATLQQENVPLPDADLEDAFQSLANLVRSRTIIHPADLDQMRGLEALSLLVAAAQQLTERKLQNTEQLLSAYAELDKAGNDSSSVRFTPLAERLRRDTAAAIAAQNTAARARDKNDLAAGLKAVEEARAAVSCKALQQMLADQGQQIRTEQAQRDQQQARERERISRDLLPAEKPVWDEVLKGYRSRVATMDFAGARQVVASAQLKTRPLIEEKEWTLRKVGWLVEWRDELISAINSNALAAPKLNLLGTSAHPVRATTERLTLQLPYGTSEISWEKLTPGVLLDLSEHYGTATRPKTLPWPWLTAVFAAEIGQTEKARILAASALKIRPELRKEADRLLPPAQR